MCLSVTVQFTLFNTLAYTTETSYTSYPITDKEFSVFFQCADLSDESEKAYDCKTY